MDLEECNHIIINVTYNNSFHFSSRQHSLLFCAVITFHYIRLQLSCTYMVYIMSIVTISIYNNYYIRHDIKFIVIFQILLCGL